MVLSLRIKFKLCKLLFKPHWNEYKPIAACKVGNQIINWRNGQQLGMRFVVNGLKHAKPQAWSLLGYQLHVKYLGKHAILVLVVVSLVISVSILHEVLQVTLQYRYKQTSSEGQRSRYWGQINSPKGQIYKENCLVLVNALHTHTLHLH